MTATQSRALNVGDEVIRRREPKGRYEETPLRGRVVAIYGDREPRARVKWTDAVRYRGRERGDNHSLVKLSTLLPATEENVRRAEERLKGRKAAAWIKRAVFYEEMAALRDEQGLPKEAEWMRREAADARRQAERSVA